MLTMVDGIGTTAYTYNSTPGTVAPGAGLVSQVSGPWPNSTIQLTYDSLGRVLSRSVNGVPQTMSYDSPWAALRPKPTRWAPSLILLKTPHPGFSTLPCPTVRSQTASTYGNSRDRRAKQIKNLNPNGSILSEFDYTYNAARNDSNMESTIRCQSPAIVTSLSPTIWAIN